MLGRFVRPARAALAARRRALHATTAARSAAESFANGTSAVYVEEMFRAWQHDPKSVHVSWDAYFRAVEAGAAPGAAFVPPPGVQPGFSSAAPPASSSAGAAASPAAVEAVVRERLALSHLIRAYAVRGHEFANLDPLGLRNKAPASAPELDHKSYGFTDADLDRSFALKGVEGAAGFLGAGAAAEGSLTLRAIIARLAATYTGSIGWEYMHINSRDKWNWIRERVELTAAPVLPKAKLLHVYDRLAHADKFERYLANKFNTAKRFGLEGCEALVPGLKALVDRATELGVTSVVFGMPHRGRLNVLVNVIRKPMETLLKEFQGTHVDMESYEKAMETGDWSGSGDVKYHLGTSFDRTYPDGRAVHLALVANPSHLEAVNPVVVGKVRAKQDMTGDAARAQGMAVLLHGDAAFAGQGVVYETFLLSQLKNYATGGTVHVICNNQVGFTTDPEYSRSTLHCSDLGKAFDIPIFHVNADDAVAVTRVFELAGEYRQAFKTDVIVDLIGYRKYGHNELDQPAFTQPVMYAKIGAHPSALELYGRQLVATGAATEAELKAVGDAVDATFAAAWAASQASKAPPKDWMSAGSRWAGLADPTHRSAIQTTGVPVATLRAVGGALTKLPPGFKLHPSLVRIMKAKEETLTAGRELDWGTAEALAFGSLMLEGNTVRLSGQDVERGTFSHRHAVLHDQATNAKFTPLAHVPDAAAPFYVCNSPLSEFAVMGFELGYSLEAPNQLVMWEAQFGDFVNGAQIIIDQFLSSGETKWFRQSGLTLLLPHGYEGQGPEHSSCRLERFLQQVDEPEHAVPVMDADKRTQIQVTNMQVVNATTPANYFHVLRRQTHRGFRKPLVVATPKSLLRMKAAVSSFADMAEGTAFQRCIPDAGFPTPAAAKKVRKLLLCSGKVYYDLDKARAEGGHKDVAIMRVEQLAPFPWDLVAEEVAKYPGAHVAWVQEEPRNMGAWNYVAPRIATATRVLNKKEVHPAYAGRNAAASPAAGSTKIHDLELHRFIADAFSL